MASINRVAYSGYDFDTWLDEFRNRLQAQFGAIYNEFAVSSQGQVLFDHVAYALDTLSFYLDRRASDLYLISARTQESVARLTRQLGYKMSSAVASSVDLQVSLTQTYPFAVTIPVGFQFVNTEGFIFEVSESVVILSGDTGPVTVPAYEGETVSENFVSEGTVNQEFRLDRVPSGKFVVAGRFEVLVDGSPWERQDFIEYGTNDVYEVNTERSPATLEFGDGIAGNVPAQGASIVATYVATSGKTGRVAENTITAARSNLVVNFTTIPLVVNNPESAVGGDDPETLAQARSQAGRVFKSRQVAVTQQDHETLAQSFAGPVAGRVAVAKAFVARGATSDLTFQEQETIINNAVDANATAVSGALADITTALDSMVTSLSTLATTLTSIATEVTAIDSNAAAAIAVARTSKNNAAGIAADAGTLAADLTAINAGDDSTDALTDGTLALLLAQTTSLSSDGTTIQAALNGQISTLGLIQDDAADIGLTVSDPDSLLLTADTARQSIATEVGDSTVPSGIYADVVTIDDAQSGLDTTVETALTAIENHIDRILSDECKTNLVSIPILARDAGGFYTAPSSQLINDLQSYLDERKEVTQVPEVVSGEQFLVRAVIRVRAGVTSGFSDSVLSTSIQAAIDGVLRGRAFGASLFLDELYNVLSTLDGLSFVNVTIEGEDVNGTTDASNLDDEGNLIVTEGKVITKGTTTVNTEIVATT
jgi:hypothetical protein